MALVFWMTGDVDDIPAQMVGRHENIVNLLGVCSQPLGQPLLVVLEFAQLGNLREFVQVVSCLRRYNSVICVSIEAAIAGGTLLQTDVGQHNTGFKLIMQFLAMSVDRWVDHS